MSLPMAKDKEVHLSASSKSGIFCVRRVTRAVVARAKH